MNYSPKITRRLITTRMGLKSPQALMTLWVFAFVGKFQFNIHNVTFCESTDSCDFSIKSFNGFKMLLRRSLECGHVILLVSQDHCYYHGKIVNDSKSSVSLSTCDGLRWVQHSALLLSVIINSKDMPLIYKHPIITHNPHCKQNYWSYLITLLNDWLD